MAVTALADQVHGVLSTAVDGAFYKAVNADLAAMDVDPVGHYAETGWREGRDPAPWFSTRAYLQAHPDVAKAGRNPLHHYLTLGYREGREVAPSSQAQAYLLAASRRGESPAWRFEDLLAGGRQAAEAAEAVEAHLREYAIVAEEFDAVFYSDANADVADTGLDLVDHFLSSGWREGRDPNGWFSVREYLEAYPDIEAAGINPFVHYLTAGRNEGRIAREDLGFRYRLIKNQVPLDQRVAVVKRASARLKAGTAESLADALAGSRTGLRDLHITFSHDDYLANTGGVQLCLQREGAQIAALGRDHLHVYPAKPWPVVRADADPCRLGVIWNGERVGVYSASTIVSVLRKAARSGKNGQRSFAVHSLLGHTADETAAIVGAAGLSAGAFWLHDFASLCAGYHLLRNDVEDCAAPPPDSAACRICDYGPWRARHTAEHERLFQRLTLTVASPSQPTLDLWRDRWRGPPAAAVVHPHARLVDRGPAPIEAEDRPLRIAHLGMPVAHKGWPVFQSLVEQFAGDPRFEFLHLGGRAVPGLPLSFHPVTVTDDNPRAMQQAIERLEVDVAVLWPLCRETFSFTAYEAVAGGAAIITGPDSGNIAAFVDAGGHGWVMPGEAGLAAALANGSAAALSRARRRPRLYDLAFSALTVDLPSADSQP